MIPAMALIAAGILGGGAALAQVPDGAEGMHGFGRLHKQLNLNPQQEDLWQKAQSAQRDAFKSLRTTGEQNRARLRAEIDKPGADLKQFAQTRDQLREQMHAQMETSRKQVRDAWFALYDTLDANQKEQVRLAILGGMDRTGRGGHRMRGDHVGQAGHISGEG
jgi:hypothetical protein